MRILASGVLYNRVSGQDRFLFSMNEKMEMCNFDYLVTGDYCIHEDYIAKTGGKLQLIRGSGRHPIGYLVDLIRALKENKKTHKICYVNISRMTQVMPAFFARMMGYRVVIHAHNSNMMGHKWLHYMGRSAFGGMKNCTRLACSEKAAQFMFGKGRQRRAEIIYNAIPVTRFRYSYTAGLDVRVEMGLGEGTVFGFVGRLDRQKNPLFLIEVFREISKIDNRAKFLIVGDGEFYDEIVSKICMYELNDRVVLAGQRFDMERLYSAMDVLLLPSIYEGLPITLIEAQAAGLISVVSEEAVPIETRIREDFINFISIKKSAKAWAIAAIDANKQKVHREEWNNVVLNSPYNIEREAIRLEHIFEEIASK